MAENFDDTIAAISTAMAPSGIGIVRISGKNAFAIADRVYSGKKGKGCLIRSNIRFITVTYPITEKK